MEEVLRTGVDKLKKRGAKKLTAWLQNSTMHNVTRFGPVKAVPRNAVALKATLFLEFVGKRPPWHG